MLEIPTDGTYEIVVATGASAGAQIVPCDAPCAFSEPILLASGASEAYDLLAGRYRVETDPPHTFWIFHERSSERWYLHGEWC